MEILQIRHQWPENPRTAKRYAESPQKPEYSLRDKEAGMGQGFILFPSHQQLYAVKKMQKGIICPSPRTVNNKTCFY